jgi:hypothetical protein
MSRNDPVQSVGEPDDSSRLEEVAGRVLRDPAANERFLDEVLSPSAKQSRSFRGGLQDLISRHQDVNIKEISRELGYLVVWPPGSAIRIGDIGSFRSGITFVVKTQLSELRPDAIFTEVEVPVADLIYSTGDVSVTADGLTTRIDFGRAGATFFSASGLRNRRISNYSEVERLVRSLIENRMWSADWNVVTEVVEADQMLLLVAGDADASVVLRGVGSSEPGLPGEPAYILRQTQMRQTFQAGPGVVPLFRAIEVSESRSQDESRSQEMIPRNTF